MSVTKILHISMLCVALLMITFVHVDTSVADNSIHAVAFSGTSNTDGATNTDSGGSSGVGEGSGNNEPITNIVINQVQYIQKMKKGILDYVIDGPKTAIVGVEFNVLKTPSNEVEIKIQKLKKRSVSINSNPPGKIYSHLNIICSLRNEIDNVKIRFEVPKSWIGSMSGKASEVKLVRYNSDNSDKWNVLPTSVIDETNETVLFEAETPGFSSFAISLVDKAEIINENGDDIKDAGTATTTESASAESTTNKESKGLPDLGFTMISLIIIVASITITHAMRSKR